MSQLIVLLERDFKNTFKNARIKRSMTFTNNIQHHNLPNSSKTELEPLITTFKNELGKYKDVVEIVAEDIDSDSDDGDSTINFSEETVKKCTELGDNFNVAAALCNDINWNTKDANFGYNSDEEKRDKSKMFAGDIPYAEQIHSEIHLKQETFENNESFDDADMKPISIVTKRRKSTNDSNKNKKNMEMEQESDNDDSEYAPDDDVKQESSDDDSSDREIGNQEIKEKSGDGNNPNKAVIKQLLDKASCYICTLCDKTVKTDAEKSSHRKSHNLRYLSFKHLHVCPKCPFKTRSSHPFRVHYQKNHSDTDGIFEWIKCTECPYKTGVTHHFNNHIKHHKEKGKLQCEYCTFSENTRQRMTVHLKLHNKFQAGIFSCEDCSYVTRHTGGLTAHRQVHHTRDEDKKWIKCKECPFKTIGNCNLKKHTKCHQLSDGYACPHCSYRSPYACRITDHIRVHFGKNEPVPEYDPKRQTPTYSCQQCSYKTLSKSHLNRHVTSHKTYDARRINCAECPFTCKDKIDLANHVKYHNGDGTLKCPWCSFTHMTKSMMTKHRRIHSEERQVKKPTKTYRKGEPRCPICNELFQAHAYLKRHMSKHQTIDEVENPVMCAHCPYRSKNKDNSFIIHIHCHFRKDGLKCDFCSFRHDRQNVMTTHLRLHTEAVVNSEPTDYNVGGSQ